MTISLALLEDHRVLRETLQDVLEHNGFRIPLASAEPREVMDGLAITRPELVVVGLRSGPDESEDSGWRTVQFIAEWYPSIRQVILAEARIADEVERAPSLGASAYLSKETLGTAELMEALRRVHRGESVFPGAVETRVAESLAPVPLGPLSQLTPREVEVLRCIASGFDNLKIAACLEVSERTVRSHVSNLYKKLNAENRTQLALLGREFGLKAMSASAAPTSPV